jgi:hypothetical protein
VVEPPGPTPEVEVLTDSGDQVITDSGDDVIVE